MRLFLALPLPPRLQAAISDVVDDLRPRLSGWRFARPEGIHLTLRFLGEVAAPDVSRLSGGWRRVAAEHPPMTLRVSGCGVFPSAKRPRVLWTGVRESGTPGTLERLAAALEGEARRLGFPPEERPFRPHLTLARAASPGAKAPQPDGVGIVGDFEAVELTLYRSELGAGGARYTALESYALEGPGPR